MSLTTPVRWGDGPACRSGSFLDPSSCRLSACPTLSCRTPADLLEYVGLVGLYTVFMVVMSSILGLEIMSGISSGCLCQVFLSGTVEPVYIEHSSAAIFVCIWFSLGKCSF